MSYTTAEISGIVVELERTPLNVIEVTLSTSQDPTEARVEPAKNAIQGAAGITLTATQLERVAAFVRKNSSAVRWLKSSFP